MLMKFFYNPVSAYYMALKIKSKKSLETCYGNEGFALRCFKFFSFSTLASKFVCLLRYRKT